jgi:predicted RNase H-like nuclease (RuvC/YqgF family)
MTKIHSTGRQAQIDKIKQVQAARKKDSLQRVFATIDRLERINAKVNFPTVAKEANLSISYLYKYPEVKQRIAEARNKQRSFPANPAESNTTAAAKLTTKLKEKIAQLESENKELKRKHESLAGQVYRVHYLQEQVERQQQTIADLQTALKDQQLSKVTPISSKRKAVVDDRIQAELDSLGIELNPTLTKTIKSATEATVLDAIEALKDQLSKKDIPNPGGWLNQAIKDGWTKPEPAPQKPSKPEYPVVSASNQPTEELVSFDELSNIFTQKS